MSFESRVASKGSSDQVLRRLDRFEQTQIPFGNDNLKIAWATSRGSLRQKIEDGVGYAVDGGGGGGGVGKEALADAGEAGDLAFSVGGVG